jgi:hypothetical protein
MEPRSSAAQDGFLSSPRAQRRLIWISGGVFAAGLVAFISTHLLRGTSGIHSPLLNQPAQHGPKLVKAPPSKAALKVARQFIETAPLRKNLGQAYSLVSPALKGDMTRTQWEKGNIPVVDYPAGNAKTAKFVVDWSYKTQMMLEVDLVATKGSGNNIRPHLGFYLGLERAGDKPNGRWLVTTWVPTWHHPIRETPKS